MTRMLFMAGNVSPLVHNPPATIAHVAVFGQAAIRQGRWKAVWLPPPTGNDKWLLYDLSIGTFTSIDLKDGTDSADPGEIKDLAEIKADKLKELVEYWHQYEAETGTVLKGPGDGAGREKMFGVKWDDWDV
jgi:arylsulfatase A-like enzyme